MAMECFPRHNLTDAWDKGVPFFSLRVSFNKSLCFTSIPTHPIRLSRNSFQETDSPLAL
jgi:hypothetical protein